MEQLARFGFLLLELIFRYFLKKFSFENIMEQAVSEHF